MRLCAPNWIVYALSTLTHVVWSCEWMYFWILFYAQDIFILMFLWWWNSSKYSPQINKQARVPGELLRVWQNYKLQTSEAYYFPITAMKCISLRLSILVFVCATFSVRVNRILAHVHGRKVVTLWVTVRFVCTHCLHSCSASSLCIFRLYNS